MDISELKIKVRIKYPRLLFWINIIPVLLGFKPFVPGFCVEIVK